MIVGADNDWQKTVVGLLVGGQEIQPINLQDVHSEHVFIEKLVEIQWVSYCQGQVSFPRADRAPFDLMLLN